MTNIEKNNDLTKNEIFMNITSESFQKGQSFEDYKNDIRRWLMLSTWKYTEEQADRIIREQLVNIKISYKLEEAVADVAVEIGYGCG